ncbi:outer membrane beta-barrel family protein [Chitinophaga solisilvae]|uniref:outer membrane beta-barrel family protein n=1 Tax=Chitinophaga solisilvae TaxID=1233460 RepID=UPI00136C70A2|nr:outer membrane beta-barrel family protein [Chitinophaga solisilvae]
MNKVKVLWMLLLTGVCLAGYAQQPMVTLKGKLISAKNRQPVIAATIRLIKDAAHAKAGLSDAAGTFAIPAAPGAYTLRIEALQCKPLVIALQLSSDTTLGDIALEEDTRQLETVTVTGTKSEIELKTDRKVFNVGKDILSKGGNVNDILNNVPSVNVDPNGAVSLRGNANVRILINGKPSMLTVNNGLRQIPASSIEKVEVITNPSSAYEAEGSAGIINIIMKKNALSGFNASLQAGLGSPANNSLNLNMSYKTKKVNIFSNVGYRYQERFFEDITRRQNFGKAPVSSMYQVNNLRNSNTATNYYLGMDYYINDRNTLTGSFYRIKVNNRDSARNNYNYYGSAGQPDSSITRFEDYREPQIFNELELNYVKTFAKKGRKWTTNLQYDFWHDDENQLITQRSLHPENNGFKLTSRDLEYSKDLFIQSDYVTPLKGSGKLEMGVRAGLRAIKSDYTASQDEILLPQYDNKLNYDENIYATYMQYGSKVKQFNYQVGLRAELSDIGIRDRKGNFNNAKRYIDFFPAVHLQYSLKNDMDLQLSYSRRINRPKFWQLNPFSGLSDTRLLTVGNPDLNPMYTNALETGILKKAGNFTLNPSVYYQFATNYFDYILRTTPEGYFLRTPVNLDLEQRFGVELNTSWNPYNWWRLSMDVNFYQFTQEGNYEGEKYHVTGKTWFSTIRSGFKFPKVVSLDLSFNYRGQNRNVQSLIKPIYRLNAGISRDFLGDRMTFTATVNNLLDSNTYQEITSTDTYYLDRFSKGLQRQFTGTLIYRFNRKKDQADRMGDQN